MMCTDLIDKSRTGVLNGSSEHATLLDVLSANPDDKALASDVDPQLLLKVFFKEKVNVSAVLIRFNVPPKANEDDEETYAKPRLIKLYCNKAEIDFGDVDELESGTQILVQESETEVKLPCVGHKFQRLESLTIFVEEGMDPEAQRSFVNRVSVIGHAAQS